MCARKGGGRGIEGDAAEGLAAEEWISCVVLIQWSSQRVERHLFVHFDIFDERLCGSSRNGWMTIKETKACKCYDSTKRNGE